MIVGSDCKAHFGLEAIDEHSGHPRALVRFAGFLFHDRSKRDQLLRRLDGQIRHPAFPDLLQHASMRLLHALDDLLARHAASESVGFRQQRALARDFLDLPGEHFVLQQARNDLLGGQTLRDGEGVLHHLAFDDGFDHVGDAGTAC